MTEPSLQLAELHHRVANSYQALGAMLALERARAPEHGNIIERLHAQLEAFGLIHRMLKPDEGSVVQVCVASYLRALCTHLERACLSGRGLSLSTDFGAGTIDPRLCQQLGLIVIELVMNAAKHAFEGREQGRVEIGFRMLADGGCVAWVADDGCGFAFAEGAATRGLGLIHRLARAGGGACGCVSSPNGARIEIRYKPQALARETLS